MRKKRKSERSGKVALWFVGVLAALAVSYMALCTVPGPERVLTGTKVNGVDLGGMTEEEAVQALDQEAQSRRQETLLSVFFEGQEYPVNVGAALTYDSGAEAAEALRPGRVPFLARGIFCLRALTVGRDLMIPPAADTGLLLEIGRAHV